MTKKDGQIEFKVGDKIVSLGDNEKGTISRLCADKDAVFVRWDKSNGQEMVEISTLNKERR